MRSNMRAGILLAVLAAALYALNAPLSKWLLDDIPPTLLAGLLYVGAGLGMGIVAGARWALRRRGQGDLPAEPAAEPFGRADLPFVLLMIGLDILAPILLMLGLSRTSAASAALLGNFEIVATALMALLLFREAISARLWAGIGCVTVACALLSVSEAGGVSLSSLRPSAGALLIAGACVSWGLENNCTRRLSGKDPLLIVLFKGIFSGGTSVAIGLCLGERIDGASLPTVLPAVLLLGFVAYGLSIFCYVYAQRMLGAARTGAYYATAPFIGTALSLALFPAMPPATYFAALALMAVGVYLASGDGSPVQAWKRLFRRAPKD